jgi:hypothetical protein
MKFSAKPRRVETHALAFWRALDAMLREAGEESPQYGEAATLFAAGYSVPQAARVLAPGARFYTAAIKARADNFARFDALSM